MMGILQQAARFFIGDAELEAVASEGDIWAAIEAARIEPQFGDTVTLTSRYDGFKWAAEYVEENRATGRTHLYLYDPFLKGGLWEDRWVDSELVDLVSKGTAIYVWTRYWQLWHDSGY